MFDETSRYARLELAEYVMPDGRQVRYVRRRLIPRGDTLPLLTRVVTAAETRLDRLTAQTIGDPEQFWRLCDANDALRPASLTELPGSVEFGPRVGGYLQFQCYSRIGAGHSERELLQYDRGRYRVVRDAIYGYAKDGSETLLEERQPSEADK